MKRREARGGPGRGDGHAGVSADSDRLVVAVFGPTASGKTAVSQSLARHLGSEVVSADSMQVYRGLPILTDQPAMPTQLVGIWPLEHEASVAEYAVLAHAAVDRSVREQGIAVVAGGTGLYLRAALTELHLPPAPALGVREHWADVYDRLGREVAHALLAERDPAAATGGAPERPAACASGHSSSPTPAPRSGPVTIGSGAARRVIRRWSSASRSCPTSWSGGSNRGRARCSRAESCGRSPRRWPVPCRRRRVR